MKIQNVITYVSIKHLETRHERKYVREIQVYRREKSVNEILWEILLLAGSQHFPQGGGKPHPTDIKVDFSNLKFADILAIGLNWFTFNEKHSRGVEIEQLIGRKLRPDFEAKARGNFHRIQPAEGWKRRALWPTTLLESSSWVRVIHTSELGCKSAFERPIWKRLNESNFSFGPVNPPSCYALWQTHLNDPVLRRPPPLPLEHGVNVGRHGHHHWLRVPPCVHVPLLCVLVDLVMVKTAKRHVCGQDNFWTLVLQEKVDFRKNLKHRQMSLLIIVHFPLVLPLLGRGRLGWWGHIVVEYSVPVASTPVYNPPSLHICMYAAQPRWGRKIWWYWWTYLHSISKDSLSLSLTDALLSICKSLPLGQTNQSTLWWCWQRGGWRELFWCCWLLIVDQHADDTNLFASQVDQRRVRANLTMVLHPMKAFPILYFTLNSWTRSKEILMCHLGTSIRASVKKER